MRSARSPQVCSKPASMALNRTAAGSSTMPMARPKKLAIWPLDTELAGQYRRGSRWQPTVMPEAASVSMLAA